jgi:hypothetical protein
MCETCRPLTDHRCNWFSTNDNAPLHRMKFKSLFVLYEDWCSIPVFSANVPTSLLHYWHRESASREAKLLEREAVNLLYLGTHTHIYTHTHARAHTHNVLGFISPFLKPRFLEVMFLTQRQLLTSLTLLPVVTWSQLNRSRENFLLTRLQVRSLAHDSHSSYLNWSSK